MMIVRAWESGTDAIGNPTVLSAGGDKAIFDVAIGAWLYLQFKDDSPFTTLVASFYGSIDGITWNTLTALNTTDRLYYSQITLADEATTFLYQFDTDGIKLIKIECDSIASGDASFIATLGKGIKGDKGDQGDRGEQGGGALGNEVSASPVQWITVCPHDGSWVDGIAYEGIIYDNGPNDDGIGATITDDYGYPLSWWSKFSNFANTSYLGADLSNYIQIGMLVGSAARHALKPQVGDRILWLDDYQNEYYNGVYVITDLGDDDGDGGGNGGWILTRATDFDGADDALINYNIAIEDTPFFARTSRFQSDQTSSPDSFDFNGSGQMGFCVMPNDGFASGPGAYALSLGSVAIGRYARAGASDYLGNGVFNYGEGRNVSIGDQAKETRLGSVIINSGARQTTAKASNVSTSYDLTDKYNQWILSMTGNTTINLPNNSVPWEINVIVDGAFTPTFAGTNLRWPGGSAPAYTETAWYKFICDGLLIYGKQIDKNIHL